MIRYPILILAGLLSAPLMELGGIAWLALLPAGLDLTANYFVMTVLPVALILYFLMALLLWKAFEPAPRSGIATYLAAHLTAQALLLNSIGNPPADIAFYALSLLVAGGLIFVVFERYFWCPVCTRVP